jgi:GNAT superfamily N-acetyltransferase
MKIEFKTTRPNPEPYAALFGTTGWNRKYQASPDELGRALDNSQHLVSAYDGERLVGFGRVLSDGVLHAMIYDMIVHPDYQHQGIGTQILRKLIQWCDQNGVREIQLFCARGKRPFYEVNGFVPRPEDAPGMQYSDHPQRNT